jgi:hypothetical protein
MLRRALAMLFACLLSLPAGAGIYTWKDAQGRVHFGDRAPGDTPAQSIVHEQKKQAPAVEIRIADASGVLGKHERELAESGIRRVHEVYTGLFRLPLRRTVLIDIHIFPTLPALQAWASGVDARAQLPSGVLGVYLHTQNVIGVWRHSDDTQRIIATLLHEASHVIVAQLSPQAPAWLQEGLAQYFEGLDVARGGYVFRPTQDASAAINAWVARGELVTLQQYFSLDDARWRHLAHGEQNPIPYVVAWSVAYFLMSKPVGRQIVTDLLQDMAASKRPPTRDAIEKRYPGGYALMEYEWFKWAQGEKKPQTLQW